MIEISADFDHGNINILDAANADNIRLEIQPDGKADYYQWFYYCVSGAGRQSLSMVIENAGGASYYGGWKDYQAVASYDGETWFRVATAFDGQKLTITHTPEHDRVFYAYFAAYPASRYNAFIDVMKTASLLTHTILGETLDGQAIDYFTAGAGERAMWVIARQHPGETMAAWWMEGFLPRLADPNDAVAASLRERATIHVVPCMNLDGARRGHLRTNAAGVDLNRAWRNTTIEASPEVYVVREKMRETGVDFFLDVHGDEVIPNVFLDPAKGIPSWDATHEMRFNRYSALLLEESADFQTTDGYPISAPGKANLDIASYFVGETWGCLSTTLEMPFKDALVNPEPAQGWSPERCRQMGRDNLAVMAQIVDVLR